MIIKIKNNSKKQIEELLKLGLIQSSSSPHQSAAFMVRNRAKVLSDTARMVINYQRLNDNTWSNGYKIPTKDI